MSQFKAASLQVQGYFLQYQVDKYKADALFEAYHTSIAGELEDLKNKYENLQLQYTYIATHQRLDTEYRLSSKRRKQL